MQTALILEDINALIQLSSIDEALIIANKKNCKDIDLESFRILAKADGSYFLKAIDEINSIPSEGLAIRAGILSILATIDIAYFPEALKNVDSIQDTEERLLKLVILAELDSACFYQALKESQSESISVSGRISVLMSLACIESEHFSILLEVIESIQDEQKRVRVLEVAAASASKRFLPTIYQSITEITHKPTLAIALSSYIPRLPLASLPYTDWKTYLHLLAHRTRADLMDDLATLYPAILHLGGEDAGRGMVGEMGRVCKQWK